jgi:hypothetical protein
MRTFIIMTIVASLHLIIINIVYASDTEIEETKTTNEYLIKTTSTKPLPTVNTDAAVYIEEKK